MKKVVIDGKTYLCLFATCDIKESTELRYDYGVLDLPWRTKVVRAEKHKGTNPNSGIKDIDKQAQSTSVNGKRPAAATEAFGNVSAEIVFDSDEDSVEDMDISGTVGEALTKLKYFRSCKRQRVYISGSDDEDYLLSVYEPSDDDGTSDDDVLSTDTNEEQEQCHIEATVAEKKSTVRAQKKATDKGVKDKEGQVHCSGAEANKGKSSQITISTGKTHVCLFCHEKQTKLQRHQRRKHKKEKEVARAVEMGSEDQILAFERLRLKGDYHHNCDVLALGQGELIVVRNPSRETSCDAKSYLPCPHCLGFFKGNELWRHVQACPHKTQEELKKYLKVQLEAKLLLPTAALSKEHVNKDLHAAVLASMKNDHVSETARNDELILNFGTAIFEKVGKPNANYVSQRMRQLARLLNVLRSDGKEEEASLEEFIDTARFDDLVGAVRHLCEFDHESRLDIGIPSLALKLGHSLKRCAQVLRSTGLRRKDEALIKRAKRFIDLFEAEWASKISARSLASLGSKHQNKVEYLPLAEDLMKLREHLNSKMANLTKCITTKSESESPSSYISTWTSLAKATLARVIIFNKRRSGETAKLEVANFKGRPNWAHCSDSLKSSLTPLERRLCERLDLIEISGKRQRKVPILLTPETKQAIEMLNERRPKTIPPANKFVFAATKGSLGHLRGCDCVASNVKEIEDGLQMPKAITGTKLRKYIATVSQTAALSEVDVDWLARHLGHDVRVHRDFYRLHESTTELAKVSKLLLAVDSGNIKQLEGKSLNDINVEDIPDITETNNESEGSSGEDDDDDDDANQSPLDGLKRQNGASSCVSERNKSPSQRKKVAKTVPQSARSPRHNSDGQKASKTVPHKSKKQTVEKHSWTNEEKRAVLGHLGRYITSGVVPGKGPCEECMKKSQGALSNRSWTDVKYFVKNEVSRRKRRISKSSV